MATQTVRVTADNFAEQVLNSDKPVLVDFWASWCPSCLRLAPVLEQLAAEKADELVVAKVNVEDYPELAQRYRVKGLPTLDLYVEGKAVHRRLGPASKQTLLAELANHL